MKSFKVTYKGPVGGISTEIFLVEEPLQIFSYMEKIGAEFVSMSAVEHIDLVHVAEDHDM